MMILYRFFKVCYHAGHEAFSQTEQALKIRNAAAGAACWLQCCDKGDEFDLFIISSAANSHCRFFSGSFTSCLKQHVYFFQKTKGFAAKMDFFRNFQSSKWARDLRCIRCIEAWRRPTSPTVQGGSGFKKSTPFLSRFDD